MQERPFPHLVRDESNEIFILTEKEKEKYEKHKKEIINLLYTVDDFLKNNTLETGLKTTCCSLLESYVQDFNKSLKYTGELAAASEQRYAEIRGLNEENRKLRELLGEKVSLEDVREKIKNIVKVFKKWWSINGCGLVSDPSIGEWSYSCTLSGHIFGNHYTDVNEKEEEKADMLQQMGFQVYRERGSNQLIYSDNNIRLLTNLLQSRFPSVDIVECQGWHYSDAWVMKDIKIRIEDLNDFEEK